MLECQPLFDSSDMTITEWVQIAQTIEVVGECGWDCVYGAGLKVGGAECGWDWKCGRRLCMGGAGNVGGAESSGGAVYWEGL